MATSLVVALKKYFGQLPGQTLSEFAAEAKQLSSEDKEGFKTMLKGEGIEAA
jgi:hypothetical protein